MVVKTLTKVRFFMKSYHASYNIYFSQRFYMPLKLQKNAFKIKIQIGWTETCDVLYYRAKKLLGTCIYVAEGPRDVFARTMMLFSLTDTVLDEDSSGQTLQL